ncbi:MAG: riboflavin kinase [Ilumatobacteraceae bacterium]
MRVMPAHELTESAVVLAVGAFDGVHRLHHAFLRELRTAADEQHAQTGLVLIDGGVHYKSRILTSLDHRLELIADTGLVDHVWIAPESVYLHLAEYLGQMFDELKPRAAANCLSLPVSSETTFSSSDFDALATARGISLVPILHANPGHASATDRLYTTRSISELLTAGHVAVAARLLGRLYEMRGVVEKGDQRGRLLGFPTANLGVHETHLIPNEGVYAGVVLIGTEDPITAAISLGRRSTFYEAGWELLEAHLLDFGADLYGQEIRVLFAEHLRGQRQFSSAAELVEQLKLDVALVREVDPIVMYRGSQLWAE